MIYHGMLRYLHFNVINHKYRIEIQCGRVEKGKRYAYRYIRYVHTYTYTIYFRSCNAIRLCKINDTYIFRCSQRKMESNISFGSYRSPDRCYNGVIRKEGVRLLKY